MLLPKSILYAISIAATAANGYHINNRWSLGKETPSQCSTIGKEADDKKGNVKEVTYFADIEAVQIAFTLADGNISTISMAATVRGNAAECDVPTTGDKKA